MGAWGEKLAISIRLNFRLAAQYNTVKLKTKLTIFGRRPKIPDKEMWPPCFLWFVL